MEMNLAGDDGQEWQLRQRLMRERTVVLSSVISDSTAVDIVERLRTLEFQSSLLPILFLINSPGGLVSAGMEILDTMRSLRAEVHTRCAGQAHSLAAIILAHGTPGHRSAIKDSWISFSGVSSGGETSPEQAEENDRITMLLIDKLSQQTGLLPAQLRELFETNTPLDANDALALGIVDEVVSHFLAR